MVEGVIVGVVEGGLLVRLGGGLEMVTEIVNSPIVGAVGRLMRDRGGRFVGAGD